MTVATAINHVVTTLEAVSLSAKMNGFNQKLEHDPLANPRAGKFPGAARRFWPSARGSGLQAVDAFPSRARRRLDVDWNFYYPPSPNGTERLLLIWQDYTDITNALLEDELANGEATTTIISHREGNAVEIYQATLIEADTGGDYLAIQTSMEHRG